MTLIIERLDASLRLRQDHMQQAQKRYDNMESEKQKVKDSGQPPEVWVRESVLNDIARDNEVLAAMGTALAALARIKEL
jgi:hypothetical protein